MSDAPAAPLPGPAARRAPMLARAVNAWGDLSGSIRAELAADPGEAKVFAWLMISLAVAGLCALPLEMFGPLPEGAERTPGMGFAVSLTFAPLIWYAVAGLAGMMVRSLGGALSYAGHRIVWFWQALVMTPVAAAVALLELPLQTLGLGVVNGVLDIGGGLLSLYVLWRFYRAVEDWPEMLSDRFRLIVAGFYLLVILLLVGWALVSALEVVGTLAAAG